MKECKPGSMKLYQAADGLLKSNNETTNYTQTKKL